MNQPDEDNEEIEEIPVEVEEEEPEEDKLTGGFGVLTAEAEADDEGTEADEEEDETSTQSYHEFIRIRDMKNGFDVMLGSNSFNVRKLANLVLLLKANWREEREEKGNGYCG